VASHAHKQLVSAMDRLSQIPEDEAAFAAWLDGSAHLAFLADNAQSDEILTHVLDGIFIQSVVVPNDRLASLDHDDVLNWDFSPSMTRMASYWQQNFDDVYIERGFRSSAAKTLRDAIPLLFTRAFDGHNSTTYEISQEYLHLTKAHWIPDQHAYCRYNEQGKLESIVSLTVEDTLDKRRSCISFQWAPLEEYLIVNNAALVRLFDFTLYRPSKFPVWGSKLPRKFYETESLFYRQRLIKGKAAYLRGAQVIRPRTSKDTVFDRIIANMNKV